MIVDFSVTNFRSIKTEQTLSMYAEKKPKHHAGNIAQMEDGLRILRTAGIYGPNASGKTNLLLALQSFRRLMKSSCDLKKDEPIIWYEPYLLSEAMVNSPTIFEIEFYIKETRYRYRIEFNKEKVLTEKLDFFPKTRSANLFTRKAATKVKFGEHYKGGRKQIALYDNNAYLSKAGNTPDAPELVQDIYNFFRTKMMLLSEDIISSLPGARQNPLLKNVLDTVLNKADLGISSFGFEEKFKEKIDETNRYYKLFADKANLSVEQAKLLLGENSREEIFYHPNENNIPIRFSKEQESKGTIKAFELMPYIQAILYAGGIILIDEIETSLHPHMAEMIIKLFNDPEVNKNNAQLIFTTHNLSLMSSQTMRKDQIYLTEKTVENGTELSNLEDFDSSLKDNSPFAKWYDEGRLGAIPSINYRDIADAIIEAM